MTASVTIGIELIIIFALAWLASWALKQAVEFGRMCRAAQEQAIERGVKLINANAELLSIKSARSDITRRGNLTKSAKRKAKTAQIIAALRSSPVVTIVQDDD